MASSYNVGTVSVTNGSAVVIGVGTLWQAALVAAGDIYVEAAGNVLPIKTVDAENRITSELRWMGETGEYAYVIERKSVNAQSLDVTNRVISEMAIELQAGTIYKYEAAGTLAGRAMFDNRPEKFGYLAHIGLPQPQLFVKASSAAGDWAGPYAYGTGPMGKSPLLEMGVVTTREPGQPAEAAFDEILDGYRLNLSLPAGLTGITLRGAYSAETAYAARDGVLYNGSTWQAKRATSGIAPPNLSVTENDDWLLVSAAGRDGTGIGDMLVSVYDPHNKQTDAFDRANHTGRQLVSTLLDGNILSGFRNKIINGAMEIWQRGTGPFTTTGYTADRWYLASGTGATNSVSRAAAGAGYPDAVKYVLAWSRSVAGSSASQLIQKMEDVRILAGRKATVSFWAASNMPTEIEASMAQVFGSGGSPSAAFGTSATTFSITGTPQQFFVTFDLPSTDGKSFGTNDDDCLWLVLRRLHNSPNPTALINIADVSVVEGDAAAEVDPSARRHIQQEFDLCRRYYEASDSSADVSLFSGSVTSGGNYYSSVRFGVPKRAIPTVSLTSGAAVGFSATTNANGIGKQGFTEQRVASSTTSTGVYTSTWRADAEL